LEVLALQAQAEFGGRIHLAASVVPEMWVDWLDAMMSHTIITGTLRIATGTQHRLALTSGLAMGFKLALLA
jgi:hypothetical protein